MKKLSKEHLKNYYENDEIECEGCLYIISTPIGNYDDISLRAIKLLKTVDILLCEDTRRTKRLLSYLKIKRKNLVSYNDNNGYNKRPNIIAKLLGKKNVGIVSDAGTPLISDPGYKLVQDCHINNIKITHAPGPSSVINGLILSGLPTNQFYFGGFVSAKPNIKKKQFSVTKNNVMTGVWFDTCLRIKNTLEVMFDIYGNRKISVARELTKIHEEIISSDLISIIELLNKRENNNKPLKGELVLIIEGHNKTNDIDFEKLSLKIKDQLKTYSVRDTVSKIVTETALPKNLIYNQVMKIKKNNLN